jgi:Sas10/Utp3/C1D family
MQVEQLTRDVSKLTNAQKLSIVKAHSPELLGLVTELKEHVAELRERVGPLKKLVDQMLAASQDVDDDIVDYLEVKQQLLLSYCVNVTFYLYKKAQGQSVKSHPVMRQLLELRYAMEKMRSLDGKLKHQIDRLLKQAADGTATSSLRPNPAALLSKGARFNDDEEEEDEGDDEEKDEDDSDDETEGAGAKDGLYRAPKMAAVPYRESEAEAERREEKLNRRRKKLSSSEIMETLREEFSTAPEASSSSGISKINAEQRRLEEEADERRNFEEDRFVRLVSDVMFYYTVDLLFITVHTSN